MRSRPVIGLLTLLLLAAACSSDTDTDTAVPLAAPSSTSPTPDDPPDAGTAPADTSSPADPGPGTAPAGQDPAPPPGSEAPATTTDGPAPSTAAPEPKGVGGFAGYYLRPAESSTVLIEVLAQPDAAPRPETVARVRDVLAGLSGKNVRATSASIVGGARQWTAEDIRALADATGAIGSRDRAVLTLLYLEGGFTENERAVGVAVRSDVAAIFGDRVDQAAGMLGSRRAMEEAVTVHEVGHLLGLVDLVLDTGREDPEHPGHSPNRDSVMYYAVESTLIGSLLTGGPPREFDQADLDDLARIRSG